METTIGQGYVRWTVVTRRGVIFVEPLLKQWLVGESLAPNGLLHVPFAVLSFPAHSIFNIQYSILNTRYSILDTQYPIFIFCDTDPQMAWLSTLRAQIRYRL